jgi:epoxide hydrolase-like predicted phosphatase
MSIKAIIFDFGEVLNAHEDPLADEVHREELGRRLNLDPDQVWSYLFEGHSAQKWMSGQITWNEFWTDVLATRGITDPAEVADFADFVFEGRENLNPEMAILLKELKGHYKLAILSNTSWSNEQMRSKLYNDFELPEGTFDVIVCSSAVGLAKPDPDIFRLVLARLDVKPEEAIFADDMANFTASAAGLGIHAHTFTTPAAFREYLRHMGVLPETGNKIDK